MEEQYLSFGAETRKLKSRLLVLSGVSLFVGLTKVLPKKVAMLGLDLSTNPQILGWFIFFITVYMMLNFIRTAYLELRTYKLPFLIKIKTESTTGNTLGLTGKEVQQSQSSVTYKPDETGTPAQELKDINKKNAVIVYGLKKNDVNINYLAVVLFDFIGPIVFSIVGLLCLAKFLMQC